MRAFQSDRLLVHITNTRKIFSGNIRPGCKIIGHIISRSPIDVITDNHIMLNLFVSFGILLDDEITSDNIIDTKTGIDIYVYSLQQPLIFINNNLLVFV